MSSNIKRREETTVEKQTDRPEKTRAFSALWERLTRNVAIATLLLLTVIAVREGTTASDQSVLTTMQHVIESQWDENVGRLTYVSNMLSDGIQVFSQADAYTLQSPVAAAAVQAWSKEEPYLLYKNAGDVFAAAGGEVLSIAHDDAERYIVRILHEQDLECLYYGLNTCAVEEGQEVDASTLLGMASPDEFAFETRRNGKAIDCSAFLKPRFQQ